MFKKLIRVSLMVFALCMVTAVASASLEEKEIVITSGETSYPTGVYYTYDADSTTITITRGTADMWKDDFAGEALAWVLFNAEEQNATKAVINSGFTRIGRALFYQMPNLEEVVIPEGITVIGWGSFRFCPKLNNVVLPSTMTSFGWGRAFDSCTGLKNITINGFTADKLKSNNFYGITLDTVYTHFGSAFANSLGGATTVDYGAASEGVFPKANVVILSTLSGTFGDDNSLQWEMNLSTKALTISGAGAMPDWHTTDTEKGTPDYYINRPWQPWFSSMEKVVVEEGITKIGAYSFVNCAKLSEVSIASSVEEIGAYAFRNNALISVELPEGLKKLGNGAISISADNVIKGWNPATCTSIKIPSSLMEITGIHFMEGYRTNPNLVVECTAGGIADVYMRGLQKIKTSGKNASGATVVLDNSFLIIHTGKDFTISKYDDAAKTVKVYNSTEEDSEAIVVFASYDSNGMLKSIGTAGTMLAAEAEDVSPFTPVAAPVGFTVSSADTIRIMLWNSLNDMNPLSLGLDY